MDSWPLHWAQGTAGTQKLRLCGVQALVPVCHLIHRVTLGKSHCLPPSTGEDTESTWHATNASDDYYLALWLAEWVPSHSILKSF